MSHILGLILFLVVTTQAGDNGVEGEEGLQEEVFTVEVFPATEAPHSTGIPEEREDEEELTDKNTMEIGEDSVNLSPTPPLKANPTSTESKVKSTLSTKASTILPPTAKRTTTTTTTTTSTPRPTTTASETTTTARPTLSPTTTFRSTTIKTSAATTEKLTTTTTEPTTTFITTTESSIHCPKDLYCDGKLLPADLVISGRHVSCDPAPAPKDHCCLPQGKHLVCYNITVDTYHLNFASERPAMSTDYMELCDALVHSQHAIVGAYSTISTAKGGGELAYRYGEWAIVRPTVHRVKDIACMIIDPTQPPKQETKQKESQETKDKINKENDTSDQNNVKSPTARSEGEGRDKK